MSVVLRREDFSSTSDYLDELFEADRRVLEIYKKKYSKLGRPEHPPEAEGTTSEHDEEEDHVDDDEDDHLEDSNSQRTGAKRKRWGHTPGPITRSQTCPVACKIVRHKAVLLSRNTDSVLLPVRWSLRSRNPAPSVKHATERPRKGLHDTPVMNEDEETVPGTEAAKSGTHKRKRNSSFGSGARFAVPSAPNPPLAISVPCSVR
ncbi:hypothetical protein C8R43DRAFT_1139916 [Mycena crocata]|nr:hypothetical protein C8R43DRAFT_1139916 [Mycena crocata]